MSGILKALDAHAFRRPNAVALSDLAQTLTYGDLSVAVHGAAAALSVRAPTSLAGAPVALALDNGPAWAVLDLAFMELGWPSLPLPGFFTEAQRTHALAAAGVGMVIEADPHPSGGSLQVAGSALRLTVTPRAPVTLPEGTAKITFTSGSTAAPKGVCLSQDQLDAVAHSLVTVIGAQYAERHLPVLPLSILLENVAGLYATLVAGGRYHVLPPAELGVEDPFRPDMFRLAQRIAAERASSLILPPELLRALILTMQATGMTLPSLRLVAVGGAKVASQLLVQAAELGLPVYEGYGLSECGSVAALNTPAARRAGSVGRVLPHLDLTISADGEVVVRTRTFLGYVGEPPRQGPLHTGDLGAVDADGFLRIDGRRASTIINAFGRNIAPEWVEGELTAQPQIGQALVFGEGLAELAALIAPASPDLGEADIARAVANANLSLPAYAQVTRWRLRGPFDRDAGELTATGKPHRRTLLEREQLFVESVIQDQLTCRSSSPA